MAKTKDKVSDAASNVKPYLDRALHDEELRENVRNAYESARTIYDELIGNARRHGRGNARRHRQGHPGRAPLDDRRAAQGGRSRPGQGGAQGRIGRPCSSSGSCSASLFNPITGPQTRKWLSDRLFGGGDDFTYQGGGSGNGSRLAG